MSMFKKKSETVSLFNKKKEEDEKVIGEQQFQLEYQQFQKKFETIHTQIELEKRARKVIYRNMLIICGVILTIGFCVNIYMYNRQAQSHNEEYATLEQNLQEQLENYIQDCYKQEEEMKKEIENLQNGETN